MNAEAATTSRRHCAEQSALYPRPTLAHEQDGNLHIKTEFRDLFYCSQYFSLFALCFGKAASRTGVFV
jgi:hypothetical protein